MKFLIRDLDTGLFYCSPARWVDSWMEATDLKDLETAWDFGKRKTLDKTNLEIFVVNDEGRPAWGKRIETQ